MDISDDLLDLDLDSGLEEGLMVCSAVSISCAMLWYSSRFVKTPQHTSILSGQHWLDELLSGHDECFHNEIRMQKFVFWSVMTTFSKISDFVYFLPFLFFLYYYPEPSGTSHDNPPTSVVTHTPDRSSMT